jgi:hypothetical protein
VRQHQVQRGRFFYDGPGLPLWLRLHERESHRCLWPQPSSPAIKCRLRHFMPLVMSPDR